MPIPSLSMQSSMTNKESAIEIFNPEKLEKTNYKHQIQISKLTL